MQIKSLHHASLIVADLERSRRFYQQVLELTLADRPDLGFDGLWLQIGEQQIHLLCLPNPDPVSGRPDHVGRDRHLAFYIDDLSALEQRLQAEKIHYTRSRSGRQALFCRDPDGNGLEFIQA